MAQTPEKRVGDSVRALRRKAGHTIGDLAELAGLDATYLNHLELGTVNPTLKTLTKIARALRVEVATLLRPVTVGQESTDVQIAQTLRLLLMRYGSEKKPAILAILKALRRLETLNAIQQLIGK